MEFDDEHGFDDYKEVDNDETTSDYGYETINDYTIEPADDDEDEGALYLDDWIHVDELAKKKLIEKDDLMMAAIKKHDSLSTMDYLFSLVKIAALEDEAD
jgi:hypothetical protein